MKARPRLCVPLFSLMLFVRLLIPVQAEGDLEEVERVIEPFLKSVTSVTLSPDGKFLYAASFSSHYITIFKRDETSGKLTPELSISGPKSTATVRVRLSRDGNLMASSAFAANSVTLFKRDATTGDIWRLDDATEGENGNRGLDFVIDANFSPDGRFIYTASRTGVGVYQQVEGKLKFVQFESAGNRLHGVRATVPSPNGKVLYAPAMESGTLAVLKLDAETGKVALLQLLEDETDGITSLGGIFRVACSADGKFVYTNSGRFQGDQAITVFATQDDETLKLVEAHVNGIGGFEGFEGGNELQISPDGTLLYALGSVSDSLARFRRDSESGKLTFLGSQQVGEKVTPGAAGLCFSPDGKFVYVADEAASSIVVFRQP